MIARVVSTKMVKTVTVVVERQAIHPLYKKAFVRTKKYLVDDQIGVKDGDIVQIEKCKPVSRHKHFKIVKVLGQNLAEITEAQLKEKAKQAIAEVMPEEKLELRDENQELREKTKRESKNSEKEVVMDDSAVKTKSRRKGRTESSK